MISGYDVALLHERTGLTEAIQTAVRRVVDSGVYLHGPQERQFERAFGDVTGAAHCVAVSSGTDALRIALLAAGIGPGDEVLVPAITFVATWLAVTSVGAVPVPVGSDDDHSGDTIDTYLIGPDACARSITSRTRAIIPVHLYGHCADMERLSALAQEHGLTIVEDCAQAHGLVTGDAAAPGLIRTYSFYPTKNLGALGDAGAIVTNDPVVHERATMLRNYGGTTKDEIHMTGLNSRMGEIQAAVLNVKLPHLAEWNRRRQEIARGYTVALADSTQVSAPTVARHARPVWHHYPVRSSHMGQLRELLHARGVGSGRHYPRAVGAMPVYRSRWGSHPTTSSAQRLLDTTLTLPIGPYLTTAEQHHIAQTVIKSSEEIQ